MHPTRLISIDLARSGPASRQGSWAAAAAGDMTLTVGCSLAVEAVGSHIDRVDLAGAGGCTGFAVAAVPAQEVFEGKRLEDVAVGGRSIEVVAAVAAGAAAASGWSGRCCVWH